VRTYTRVDEGLLRRAPRLKVVGRAGVGYDNIDVSACRRRGVEVVYTPEANTQAVLEYVVALLGDALRPRVRLERAIAAREWHRLREETVAARAMAELTLGILGLGRIGTRVAEVGGAIGFKVIFNDLRDIPSVQRAGADAVTVTELFQQSDVLTIHIDGRASNRAFVNDSLLRLMKPDVTLINTSRGFVVDTPALAAWLRAHPQAQALLDVHEPEPFGPDYPLLGLPNAKLYPHLASRTESAMRNMSWVVRDVVAVLGGERPQWPANSRLAADARG